MDIIFDKIQKIFNRYHIKLELISEKDGKQHKKDLREYIQSTYFTCGKLVNSSLDQPIWKMMDQLKEDQCLSRIEAVKKLFTLNLQDAFIFFDGSDMLIKVSEFHEIPSTRLERILKEVKDGTYFEFEVLKGFKDAYIMDKKKKWIYSQSHHSEFFGPYYLQSK